MERIELTTVSRGIERLVIRVKMVRADGTHDYKDIDLSGNTTMSAYWGAKLAVEAINKLLA